MPIRSSAVADLDCDAVVVGSGPSGATVAEALVLFADAGRGWLLARRRDFQDWQVDAEMMKAAIVHAFGQPLQRGVHLGVQRCRAARVQPDGIARCRRSGPGQRGGLAHAALRRNHGRVSATSPW